MYINTVYEDNSNLPVLNSMESPEKSLTHTQSLETPPLKRCYKCKQWLPLTEFHKDKTTKDGLSNQCKECRKQHYLNNKEKILEYSKQYRIDNPEKVAESQRKWKKKNPEKITKQQGKWTKKNPEKVAESQRKWAKNNREYLNEYEKNRHKVNPQFNLNCRMSSAIRESLKGNKNGQHWEDLVGYTCKDLMEHLKKTIPTGYTWQDFMSGELHIDHIIPKSVFNYTKPEHPDFKRCWALKNLQLLPAEENISKGDKHKPFSADVNVRR